MNTIAIVDYGMGNLRSVAQAVEHVKPNDAQVIVTSDAHEIENADRVVFPGQGAAQACMEHLEAIEGLEDAVFNAAKSKPFLGICMGMQVLMEHSKENNGTDCLGLFEGDVNPFKAIENWSHELKVPQMGWNHIHERRDHALWHNIENPSRFYFVHSYYVEPKNPDIAVGMTEYGITYCSAIAHKNLFAIQAHPEKSADAGLQLLKNFCQWNGDE